MREINRASIINITFFILILFSASVIFGQDTQLPHISVDELKALMDNNTEIVILDTQPKKLYDRGHIKGAISFPFKMRLDGTEVLELPRDKLIVLYCDCGPGEADSNHLGLQLRELGFLDVKVLAAPSIRGWKEKNFPMGE
ncbi:MAG: rhodanese-like domain-containing protein [Deltaproteobacteria bacterium]|nr:rhodanese-like domain-containing protein [Deltaproteobacteria bacterium]